MAYTSTRKIRCPGFSSVALRLEQRFHALFLINSVEQDLCVLTASIILLMHILRISTVLIFFYRRLVLIE